MVLALDMDTFHIDIPDAELTELRARLHGTRWPDQVGAPWLYGTPVNYLKELCGYWADTYDWRAWEARLNSFDQFQTTIGDQRLHFIHQRSSHAQAVPLVICHGWPGSVVEFHKIVEPLTQPERFGGDPADAFHVVCPSIPGYGFSAAPTRPGFHAKACAQSFAGLMAALGYDRYFAQGGDWGAAVTSWLGADDAAHVAGIHLNMAISPPPRNDPMAGVTEAERERLERRREQMANELGYQHIQRSKPQTLGYGLNDSPAGLAGWIVEKFHGWTQHDGDFETVVSRDEVLTNISVYWFTQTITSSARLYYENQRYGDDPRTPGRVDVPTAVAMFPGELYQPPRAWVQRQFNLQRWTEMPRGGHFAALEAPQLLAEDVRAFVRSLR